MSTLAEAQKGQQSTVGQILGSENAVASLAKFGIVPGAPISVENVSKVRQTVDIVVAGHHRTLPFKVAALVELFDGAAPAPAPADDPLGTLIGQIGSKKPAPAPQPKAAPSPKPETKPAAPTASPDGKRRVSIANSDPQAVRDAAKNDPAVGKLAELFDGEVIDIHRPVEQ